MKYILEIMAVFLVFSFPQQAHTFYTKAQHIIAHITDLHTGTKCLLKYKHYTWNKENYSKVKKLK